MRVYSSRNADNACVTAMYNFRRISSRRALVRGKAHGAKGLAMKETPQEYTKRILSYVDGKDPLKIQKSTSKKLQKLIKPLKKKEMKRRPAPNQWSIAEILAHLSDAEVVGSWRLRLIMGSNGTAVAAFDQDAWAQTFDYANRDPRHSLKAFRSLRENNLALLKSVPKKLWENHGMHSGRKRSTTSCACSPAMTSTI
jgi:DinB superfamily